MSTQEPAQRKAGTGQAVAHVPLAQTSPGAQGDMHAPQCAGSLERETHSEPHAVSPLGQKQVPSVQSCPAEQALRQRPQFRGSARVLMQPPEHSVWLALHAFAQTPSLQNGVFEEHTDPHAPQLAGSAASTTQRSPQSVVPEGQAHAPLMQIPSVGQTVSQEPQCARSARRSTHPPLQFARSAPHEAAHRPKLQTGSPPPHDVSQSPQ
jgi:hypothetical protein